VGDATADTNAAHVGAAIKTVSSGGAAAAAGLRKGDVVTELGGVQITDGTDLTAQVRYLAGGSKTSITYVRNGQSRTADVTLGTYKAS
jgi:S1-C subfamily serine protease